VAKKYGDGRKLYTSGGSNDQAFRIPSEDVWKDYERKSQCKMSTELRTQLAGVTMMYAIGGPGHKKIPESIESISVKEATKKIELWRDRTNVLKNQLRGKQRVVKEKEAVTRASFIKQYDFKTLKHSFKCGEPLAFFGFVLEACLAAADLVLKEINSSQYPGTRDAEAWLAWVGLIILLFQQNDMPIVKSFKSAKPTKPKLEPAFIDLVDALQQTLPPHLQRRKSPESLRKGTLLAWKLSVGVELDALLYLSIGWWLLHQPTFDKLVAERKPNDPWSSQITAFVSHYNEKSAHKRTGIANKT
jgi:hypothetical protein